MSLESICGIFLSCQATLISPVNCSFTLEASPVQIGFFNASLDLPSNWMFTPPGASCGSSYVSLDNVSSSFIYNENDDLCETTFTLPLDDFVQYTAIIISDIGQALTFSRPPSIEPLLTPSLPIVFTRNGFHVDAMMKVSKDERCTDFPLTFQDVNGAIWQRNLLEQQVCGTELLWTYKASLEIEDEHKIGENQTHDIYIYEIGGALSICESRLNCIKESTFTFGVLKPVTKVGHPQAVFVTLIATLLPGLGTGVVGIIALVLLFT